MIPGEYQLKSDDIELCVDREPITINVANTGDRPIPVSYTHLTLPTTPYV